MALDGPPIHPGTGLVNSFRELLQFEYRVTALPASIATVAPSQPPGWYQVRLPKVTSVPLSCEPPARRPATLDCPVMR